MGLKDLISSWRDRWRRKGQSKVWPPRPWPPPPPSIRRGDPVYVDDTGCVQTTQQAADAWKDWGQAIGITMNSATKGASVMVSLTPADVPFEKRYRSGVSDNETGVRITIPMGDALEVRDRSTADTFGSCIHLSESKWACRRCKWLDICK